MIEFFSRVENPLNQSKFENQSPSIGLGLCKKTFSPFGFARQLIDLAKLYFDNESKYIYELYDIPDSKVVIFIDYCGKVGLQKYRYHFAFSSMLRDRARKFHYDQHANRGYNFGQIIALTKGHFETEEKQAGKPHTLEDNHNLVS